MQDLHDPYYDSWEVVTPVLETGSTQDGEKQGLNFTIERDCNYFLSIYPSQAFEEQYKTSEPWMLVTAVAGVLVFAVAVFYFYDRLVVRIPRTSKDRSKKYCCGANIIFATRYYRSVVRP